MYTPIKHNAAEKLLSKSVGATAPVGSTATFFSPLRSNVGSKDENGATGQDQDQAAAASLARNLSAELALVVGAEDGSTESAGDGSKGPSNSNSRANSGRHAQVRKGNKQVTGTATVPSRNTENTTALIARWWLEAARYSLTSYHGWYEVSEGLPCILQSILRAQLTHSIGWAVLWGVFL